MKYSNKKVVALSSAFNNSGLRQRMLITAAILIALHSIWDVLIYQPQLQELERTEVSLESDRLAIEQHRLGNLALDSIQVRQSIDEIAEIKQQIAELERKIKRATNELIAPEQMPGVLHELLSNSGKLKVTSLHTEPAEIVDFESDAVWDINQQPVYKHRLTLGLEGNYLNTLAYIRAVETMQWRIFWDAVKIDSSDYPRSRVSISLYTLSLDEGWIGV